MYRFGIGYAPGVTLMLSALLAFVCAIVSTSQMTRIKEKENRENDKGYLSQRLAIYHCYDYYGCTASR